MTAAATTASDPRAAEIAQAMEQRVAHVVLGKANEVRLAMAVMLAGEHLLLDDAPGVGKTTLGTALARVIGGTMSRVQGTPDLMPTDLTGSAIYDPRTGEWGYRPGPLHAHVVLVDELNRITPRTQSALLEAMAEGQITVDGTSRRTPDPFMVVATMNPAGDAGTFALTSSQVDRFAMSISLGGPDRPTERDLLRGNGGRDAVPQIDPVIPIHLMPRLQGVVAGVHVSDVIIDYVLDLADRVRSGSHLSIRGPQAVLATSRALALLEGRDHVVPDDVQSVSIPCLAHRLVATGLPPAVVTDRINTALDDIAVPVGTGRGGDRRGGT
ncbi:MAG: AAA family ATPase [Acidimicrobiales bacterium]